MKFYNLIKRTVVTYIKTIIIAFIICCAVDIAIPYSIAIYIRLFFVTAIFTIFSFICDKLISKH